MGSRAVDLRRWWWWALLLGGFREVGFLGSVCRMVSLGREHALGVWVVLRFCMSVVHVQGCQKLVWHKLAVRCCPPQVPTTEATLPQ
jgi:hypothetical protein